MSPSKIKTTTIHITIVAAALALLTACGGGGGGDSTPPAAQNQPPTANAGADASAQENATVPLAASGSDPDGGAVSFAWTQVSGPAGSFNDAAAANTSFNVPALSGGVETPIVLRVTVRDSDGATASDDLTITAASADVIVYTASRGDGLPRQVYAFDPRTNVELLLSGIPIAGGNVQDIVLSPNRQLVAYIADENVDGRQELFVAAIDGSGVAKVSADFTNPQTRVGSVVWSPDSSRIAYSIDATTAFINEVFMVDADGGNHMTINSPNGAGVSTSFSDPSWSPDGRYVSYVAQDNDSRVVFAIDVFDTQSGLPTQRIDDIVRIAITPNPLNDRTEFRNTAWAPDSSALAFLGERNSTGEIELFRATPGGVPTIVLNDTLAAGGRVYDYAWSPDATQIAYIAEQDTDARELYVAEADGSSSVRVSAPLVADGDVELFTWAPDSTVLAYRADQTVQGEPELWIASRNGSGVVRANSDLVAGGDVSKFDWAPNSSMIAYVARQETAGLEEVFVTDVDGTNNRKVNGAIAAGGNASIPGFGPGSSGWSPDGNSLMYVASEDIVDRFQVIVADLGTGDRTVISPPAVPGGFLRSAGMWSADGESVLYASEQEFAGIRELFLSDRDATQNLKISGTMTTGGRVFRFESTDSSVD